MPGAGTPIPLYQVDAFTDTPFAGNPAAVCILEDDLPDDLRQRIAAEMNLSETAFVEPPDAEGVRTLRWFTPTTEVPLCGHATLATGHVLRERGASLPLRFRSGSGPLSVEGGPDGALVLDFPADPPTEESAPAGLLEALRAPPASPTLASRRVWIVRLESAAAVRELEPDPAGLAAVELTGGRLGVSVTARGEGEVDFVSRFFAPWVGVAEDPVTGLAHTVLGPYWGREMERDELRARQLSRRGGRVGVRLEGDRVRLSGHAVTVAEGALVGLP